MLCKSLFININISMYNKSMVDFQIVGPIGNNKWNITGEMRESSIILGFGFCFLFWWGHHLQEWASSLSSVGNHDGANTLDWIYFVYNSDLKMQVYKPEILKGSNYYWLDGMSVLFVIRFLCLLPSSQAFLCLYALENPHSLRVCDSREILRTPTCDPS